MAAGSIVEDLDVVADVDASKLVSQMIDAMLQANASKKTPQCGV